MPSRFHFLRMHICPTYAYFIILYTQLQYIDTNKKRQQSSRTVQGNVSYWGNMDSKVLGWAVYIWGEKKNQHINYLRIHWMLTCAKIDLKVCRWWSYKSQKTFACAFSKFLILKKKKRGEFILHLDVLNYAEIPQKPKICMAAFWKS